MWREIAIGNTLYCCEIKSGVELTVIANLAGMLSFDLLYTCTMYIAVQKQGENSTTTEQICSKLLP